MQYLWGCFQNSSITLVINSHEFWAHCSKTLLVMNYLQGAQELRAAHGNPENIGHSLLRGCSVHPVKYPWKCSGKQISKISIRISHLFLFRDTDKKITWVMRRKPQRLMDLKYEAYLFLHICSLLSTVPWPAQV